MKKVFHVRLAHVKPLPSSEMAKQSPRAKGAFVDCVIAAATVNEARTQLSSALVEDGYELLELDEILRFDESTWEDREVELAFKGLAWEALFEGKVGYGPFNCYEQDPR